MTLVPGYDVELPSDDGRDLREMLAPGDTVVVDVVEVDGTVVTSLSDDEPGPEATNDSAGYTPAAGSQPALSFAGYVDLGFAHAGGDGTSWNPNDTRVPLDYGTDSFASAVNSRGEVASTDSKGRFTNHFLPRSVGIGSTPSLLLNTVSMDMRYQVPQAPLLFFVRAQLLPRFSTNGDATRLWVEHLRAHYGRLDYWQG